ncbi:MAG: hypothetical protein K2M59_03780 [Muribaculaceae bacterium]|nr:hypothetical protein [Muribaculaceae bacterium]MDE7465530.1 hypothetical protein [Muribaculaceae bacterium]
MKTELTIEESARLIELGVDAKLASKCQNTKTSENPVFDLSDLLSILPKEITTSETIMGDDFTSDIEINWYSNVRLWKCGYTCLPLPVDVGCAPELIDALYQLLIWAIEQGYLKTEKK